MTLEAFVLRLPGQESKKETRHGLAGETRALKNRTFVWLELGLGLTISIFLMEVELHKAGPIIPCKHNRIISLRKSCGIPSTDVSERSNLRARLGAGMCFPGKVHIRRFSFRLPFLD